MSQGRSPELPDDVDATLAGSASFPSRQGDEGGQDVADQQDQTIAQRLASGACPACGQPTEAGSRFCQSCGAQIGAELPPTGEASEGERSRRWFPLFLALWLVIMFAALVFLYGAAIQMGST